MCNGLADLFKDSQLLVTGYQVTVQTLSLTPNVRSNKTISDDIKDFLERVEVDPKRGSLSLFMHLKKSAFFGKVPFFAPKSKSITQLLE